MSTTKYIGERRVEVKRLKLSKYENRASNTISIIEIRIGTISLKSRIIYSSTYYSYSAARNPMSCWLIISKAIPPPLATQVSGSSAMLTDKLVLL